MDVCKEEERRLVQLVWACKTASSVRHCGHLAPAAVTCRGRRVASRSGPGRFPARWQPGRRYLAASSSPSPSRISPRRRAACRAPGGSPAASASSKHVRAAAAPAFGAAAERLSAAIDALNRASLYLTNAPVGDALAGATAYLRLFSLTLGGTGLAKAGLAGLKEGDPARAALARFFCEKLLIAASGLADAIEAGGASLAPYESILAEAS